MAQMDSVQAVANNRPTMTNRRRSKCQPENADKFKNDKMKFRYYAKTPNQVDYVASIANNPITICTGYAGTGKTALALCVMCDWLLEGKIEKLVLTKPFVQSGRGIGFLKGDVDDKVAPYLTHFEEYLDKFLGVDQKIRMFNAGKIEVVPLEFMRGVTFHNSMILLDEGQNATESLIIMLLTRMGEDSKVIINGDDKQTDLLGYFKSGLPEIVRKLGNCPDDVGIIHMGKSDILRSGVLGRVLSALEQ